MILLGALFALVGLGLAIMVAARVSGAVWPSRAVLAAGGCFLTVLGLLWCASLLLPAPWSWLTAIAALLLVLRGTREKPIRLSVLLVPAELAVLVFHLTLALFDVAMSTRPLKSDWDLLLAAVERSLEVGRLVELSALVALVALGILGGRLPGQSRWRNGR